MDIQPHKAFMVFTEEAWGCVSGQRIISEVTDKVTVSDTAFVRLDEIKNSEDRDNRSELYLYFPAQEINNLPGYYILRLSVRHTAPDKQGYLMVDKAGLAYEDKKFFLEISATAEGTLAADLFYSRHKDMQTIYLSCPEADVFEPFKAEHLRLYAVQTGLKMQPFSRPENWTTLRSELGPHLLIKASAIDACEQVLERIDKEFSAPEHLPFLWQKSLLTTSAIERILSASPDRPNMDYSLSITLNNKGKTELLNIGSSSFVPIVVQKIAVSDGPGRIIPGELRITSGKYDIPHDPIARDKLEKNQK
jgi:hypothetical protein